MKIGGVEIAGAAALAPMAGVTDRAFRTICRDRGCTFTVTEMVSAKALVYQDKKTCRLLELGENEHPAAVQLFGSDSGCMVEAAAKVLALTAADIIDINMGCPTPKIVNNGDGCALMRTPELAGEIIRRVKDAVAVPVTVKIRLGWDRGSVNCVEFARMAEASGAAALAVHGRTRSMQYGGAADWDTVRRVKEAVGIPVWVNGDVVDGRSALRALAASRADGVMIGRGAFGNPWIFNEISAALRGVTSPGAPSVAQRCETMNEHFLLAVSFLGERVAVLEARKHFAWYLRGLPVMAPYKRMINAMQTAADAGYVIESILKDSKGLGQQR